MPLYKLNMVVNKETNLYEISTSSLEKLKTLTNLTIIEHTDTHENIIDIELMTDSNSIQLYCDQEMLERFTIMPTLTLLNIENSAIDDLRWFIYVCDKVNKKRIAKFPNLTHLHAANNSITDLNGIESCQQLFYVDIRNNNLFDVTLLKSLRHLTILDIASNPINNVLGNNFSPLGDIKTLESLYISCTYFDKISCLYKIPKLHIIVTTMNTKNNMIIAKSHLYNKLREEYDTLLEKYWILTKFSDKKEFHEQIIDIQKFLNPKTHSKLCNLMNELETTYDRLYYAPYGPHFMEGLRLCCD